MHEQAFRFGRASHLVGITGLPSGAPAGVGVIVLNAGLVHRVGPFRMNVEMTRRLNARGYPTLRFDMSTLGDSGASDQSQSRTQQVCADVDDAMQLLGEQAGCSRFVLIGLCSGAQNAHTVANTDAKVAGAVFLDGYAYRTAGYRLRYYLPRLFDLGRWRRLLSRRHSMGSWDGASADAATDEQPIFAVAPAQQSEVRTDLASMLDRGVKLCMIYSGGISNYFNHVRQFRECFGSVVTRKGFHTGYLEDADHTYILTGDRARLFDNIEQWLSRNFPVATAGTRP
jgi:pimeloyl-ACP methyl ester carboxylesterase